jgi:cytochrome c oxidase accessory protein FixG
MKLDLQSYRRLVRYAVTLIFFAIPFIKVSGESLLRFDIPTLRLLVFGRTIWIENFFPVVLFILAMLFLFITFTQLFGRIWCGWLCPQTLMTDFTPALDNKKACKLTKLKGHAVMAILSIAVSACMVWYFVTPYDFAMRVVSGDFVSVPILFWLVITAITYIHFVFIRRSFCTSVCPYAKLQGIMFDEHTMAVTMKPDRKSDCINCLACVKACPTNIDIRGGFSGGCINCARCIQACGKVMAKRNKTSIIGYVFGLEDKPKFFRANVLITGGAFLFFALFFILKIALANPFDFEIYPIAQSQPRIVDGKVVNSFELKLTNRTANELVIGLSVKDEPTSEVYPESVFTLEPWGTLREDIFVSIDENAFGKYSVKSIILTAESEGDKSKLLESEAGMRKPFGRKK